MKTTLTLKQRLNQDRVRKQLYREALRSRGFVQHTIWSSPEGWAVLHEMVTKAGPGLILKKNARTVRGTATMRGGEPEGIPVVRQGASGEKEQGVS